MVLTGFSLGSAVRGSGKVATITSSFLSTGSYNLERKWLTLIDYPTQMKQNFKYISTINNLDDRVNMCD